MRGGGLHVFTLGDIPVRVSLWYGLLLLYWFQSGNLTSNLIWAGVVTISILVHELGHALVARHYRLRPSILLHGLGGLCQHDRAERDRHDVFIIAAGPGAGLVLGLLTYLFMLVAPDLVRSPEHPWIGEVVQMSLWVNITWSFVNLVPMWPLDGGQLFRLLMLRLANPKLAEQITHWTAIVLLGIAALAIWTTMHSLLLVLLVVWIGWANVRALRGGTASGPIRTTNKHAKMLLSKAKQAYADQDFAEAARLGHQIRGEANVADTVLRETFRILGVSSARIGEHRDALSFLNRAAPSPDVIEAKIECLHQLGRDRELEELLSSKDFRKLEARRRDEILQVVRASD